MDIKKQYFELVKQKASLSYTNQAEKMKKVAKMFGECMENKGVVQLFGYKHCEEFVNELNFRAGGIAPYHAYKFRDLVLKGKLDQKVIDSKEVLNSGDVIELFENNYQLDPRDLYVIVSFDGTEVLHNELARRMKESGHKVVGIVNKKSYDLNHGTLLNYCDEYLDMLGDEPDLALDINGVKVGQLSSTIANIMAQMLTAEVYNYFVSNGKEAPVLLSANVKGADVHNNSLTDPYERRVR